MRHNPKSSRSQRDNELAVFLSLAIALGITVGAGTVLWMWSIGSERDSAVASMKTEEIP